MPQKTVRGNPLGFSNIYCGAKQQKNERGTLWSDPVLHVTRKNRKIFWFSSLGQIVQFGAIIFCRTFRNYFGQFVWIEKKRVTIILAFHFMKRRLKTIRKRKLLRFEPHVFLIEYGMVFNVNTSDTVLKFISNNGTESFLQKIQCFDTGQNFL